MWEGPGGGCAWLSNARRRVRIDYICIPMEWMCYAKRAIVDREVILAMVGEEDHFLARVDLQ